MEHIPEDDILQIGLNLLKNLGEGMHYRSRVLDGFRVFNIVILGLNLFFILANFAHIGADYAQYIKTTECSLTICHALFKYFLFLYYKADIEALLDDLVKFWDLSSFGDHIFNKMKALYRVVKLAQIYYSAIGLSCIVSFFLKPLINTNNRFLFLCWTFSDSIQVETAVLACQYYFWVFLYPIVFGYDSLYFSYCVHIIVQVRLLKHRLQNMPLNVQVDEIVRCIEHHNLLLSIFARMKKVYFWVLLLHYFITLVTGCTLLYVVLLGATDKADLSATIFYILGLLVQFAYYSFPVEEIVFELTDMSRAIYMSSWYRQNAKIKKILLFIMTKTQREKYLSAGGIIDINVDAFGSVCRKAFSFYAILKNAIAR